MQLGFNFQNELIEKIKQVTSEQIQECANKYFIEDNGNNFVVSILRPSI
jgi:predicted Zn-dependent peptidase